MGAANGNYRHGNCSREKLNQPRSDAFQEWSGFPGLDDIPTADEWGIQTIAESLGLVPDKSGERQAAALAKRAERIAAREKAERQPSDVKVFGPKDSKE